MLHDRYETELRLKPTPDEVAQCPAAARAHLLRGQALIQLEEWKDAGLACWDAMGLDDAVTVESRNLLKLASYEGREDLALWDESYAGDDY